jgi:hypothetical protein
VEGGQQVNDKFEKFTERARKVLSLAQDEAQRFNHNYIGTEHLLLGLVREGDGVAAKVLANLGVELNKVRSAVEFIIGRGDRIVLGEIGLTPRAKKVIELAVDEARRLNHHYIGTEHLLLGLVREGEGIAAGVLESLGVNLEKVRSQTIQVLSQGSMREGVSSAPVRSTHFASFPGMVGMSGHQATVLPTTLSVTSLILLGLGVTQMTNNIAFGLPTRIGLDLYVATALLGAICALQALGLLLVMRRLVIGYTLTFAAALFWIVTSILDRIHVLSATAIYYDSLLAQILYYAILGLGIVIVVVSFATPLTVNYGNGRRRRRWR